MIGDDESPQPSADRDAPAEPEGSLAYWRGEAARWRRYADRLERASRVTTDWMWETDPDGRVIWMSSGIERITGRPAADEVGRRTLDANRPRTDEHAESWQRYLDAKAARLPFRDLIVDRTTDRGVVTVSISGEPRFDADGSFLGYRGASRDITAEVAARKAAAQARRQLQQTLEHLPASVAITDANGRILIVNREWRESMGADLPPGCDTWEAVVRHHVAAGSYPQAVGREDEFVAWRLSLTAEHPVPEELPWRDRWALVVDRRMDDGSVVHLAVDVTERRRAEAALEEAELRWRFALEGAGEGVWDWDGRSDRTYFSHRWKEMLGLADEDIGTDWRQWADRIHDEDRERVLKAFLDHMKGRTEVYETEYRLRHREGHYIWLRDRGKAVLRDGAGQALRIVGTHTDITRQRQVEEDLREKRAAELANHSKSEFLSRMSHEMRTPLNAILGFAQLMQQRRGAVNEADRGGHLDAIVLAGEHLRGLIDDVLDLQQVEAGVLTLDPEPLDLGSAAREVSALLALQAQRQGVVQSLDLPTAGTTAWVSADRRRLRQVLLNLGSNAIKYNRPGGGVRWRVVASASAGRPGWFVVVQDDGPGLDARQRSRLFQPFERLGQESGPVEGTGLGLVIARRLTEAMGGEVGLDSRPGEGTTATCWLPAAAAPRPDLPPDELPLARTTRLGRPWQVLYVEDDALSALLMVEALRGDPALEVRVAADGREALAMASTWTPDLLLVDGHLPGALGHEVLAALRALPGLADVPAVMATADALPEQRQAALARGFQDHWPKPLDVRTLPARVRRWLPGSQAG